MYAIDFKYDDKCLSDFGFIICDFNQSSSASTLDYGDEIELHTTSFNKGRNRSLVSIEYKECLSTTFSICRNPDIFDNLEITTEEYTELIRWLCRNKFLKIHFFDDVNERRSCYYNALLTAKKVVICDKLVGIEIDMKTDKPFGYGDTVKCVQDFSSISKTLEVIDTSDTVGYVVPNIKIEVGSYGGGTITLTNNLTNTNMKIKGCTSGEIITINGKTQSIVSNKESHKILNDFNYEFLTIGNKYDNRKNIITVDNKCIVTIEYEPIIKNIPN